jgi:probable selenium-dependent hydroxylase accessory protein YqeC
MHQQVNLANLPDLTRILGSPQVITLIGGGGKTSLMQLWAHCLQERGFAVVTTTTTKIYNKPQAGFTFAQPVSLAEAKILLDKIHDSDQILTLTGVLLPAEGKLTGIPVEWVEPLSNYSPDTIFLIEGDGSAGRSLKAHLSHEPVIPACTSLLVPIIGLDVLGQPLNDENVHRSEVFSKITGNCLGTPIDPAAVLTVLLHKEGYLRQCPDTAVVLPFLNKAENLHTCRAGFHLAQRILAAGQTQIKSVLVGSVAQNCFVRLS